MIAKSRWITFKLLFVLVQLATFSRAQQVRGDVTPLRASASELTSAVAEPNLGALLGIGNPLAGMEEGRFKVKTLLESQYKVITDAIAKFIPIKRLCFYSCFKARFRKLFTM